MLEESVKNLAQGKNFGTLTTLLKDGSPMTHVMWVDADDEHVIINTEVHRAKFKNIERDPRVAVTIFDAANPYLYREVRGVVTETVRGPEARSHINKLAQKYNGKDYDDAAITSERVIVKITPTRQRGMS